MSALSSSKQIPVLFSINQNSTYLVDETINPVTLRNILSDLRFNLKNKTISEVQSCFGEKKSHVDLTTNKTNENLYKNSDNLGFALLTPYYQIPNLILTVTKSQLD